MRVDRSIMNVEFQYCDTKLKSIWPKDMLKITEEEFKRIEEEKRRIKESINNYQIQNYFLPTYECLITFYETQ